MPNAELFRNIFASKLLNQLLPDKLHTVLDAFDDIAREYQIEKKQTDIITMDSVPEIVRSYIAIKSIANCSKGTLGLYKYRLFHFFEHVRKPFTSVSANDIRMYLHTYKAEQNVSDSTLENTRRILNGFFQWSVDNGYLMRNPCATVEHIKFQEHEREPLTSLSLEQLRFSCKTIREKALVDFLYTTGCRVSECVAINLSDINWVERSVIIRHGKGNKRRVVFFNAESEVTLKEYLKTRTDSNEALFVSCRSPHNRLSVRGIETEIRKIGDRMNIRIYPHKLRHTFATASINGGMPLDRLQALMGHANPRTTLIYAKINNAELQMEHRRVYA